MEFEENPFCIQESFHEQDTNLEESLESQITGTDIAVYWYMMFM